jgi:hypothetical protein
VDDSGQGEGAVNAVAFATSLPVVAVLHGRSPQSTGQPQKTSAIVIPYSKRVVVWFNEERLVGYVAMGFGGMAP